MTKFTYTATASDGTVFTRKSERTYTHVVVATRSYNEAMTAVTSDSWRKTDISNFGFNLREIAAWNEGKADSWRTEAQIEKMRAEMAGCSTPAQYVTKRREARIAAVQQEWDAGYYSKFRLAGFCGRRDLAEKLAAKEQRSDNRVEILTVTVK